MRILRSFIAVIAAFLWVSGDAQSVLGGNITWECVGANQYEVTLMLYRDCTGTPGEATSVNMLFSASGCAGTTFTADLDYVSSAEISDLCATELPNSSCGGVGATPGTMQVIYSGVVTLTPGCTWDLIWNNWFWNVFYVNQDIVFLQDAYIRTTIDTSQPCGNSPDILSSQASPQVPYLCLNDPYVHNAFISLPAGYSCTYTLASALTTGATDITSVPTSGYTLPAGMTINPLTGIINWTPTVEGYYTVTVEMDVSNGANYVGTIYENMTFVVRDCSPTNTQFTLPQVTSTGPDVTLTGANNLAVCVGDSLNFTVEATNPDLFRGITLSYTNIAALPFTFTQTGVNPAVGTFSLVATQAMVAGSPYLFQIHAIDDACPNPDTDDIAINITISPNIQAITQDTTICFGQSVNLQATGLGSSNYQWSVLTGGDNVPPPANNVSSQNVTPDFTTFYRVTAAGVPASCVSSDTIQVTVAMTDLTFATNSESCGNTNGSIDLTVLGDGSGNYNFDWTGAGTVDGQEDQSNLNGGVGVNYTVMVTDLDFNCSLTETVGLSELAAPTVTLSPNTTICNGGNTTLSFDFTAGQPPFDIDFTVNPANPTPADVIDTALDPYTVVVSPTQTTTYTVVSITDGFGCTANLNQSIVVTVRNPVTSTFLPENAICVGGNLILDVQHSQTGTYNLVYTVNGANQDTVLVADNGTVDVPDPSPSGTYTYDIEAVYYNDAPLPACPSLDANSGSISVTVYPLPTAVLSGDAAICAGDCYNQTITLTGTGPWTIGYTAGGVAQAPLVVPAAAAPYNYTWNVCPAGTTVYCLTSVQDAHCSNTVTNECATITVNSYPVVNYTITSTQLCSGACTNVNVTVAPAGSFTAVFTDTPNDPAFGNAVNVNTPYSVQICPTADTDYRLDSVYYNGIPQCATVLNQTISVEVNGNVAVMATDTICNSINTQYQVVYTVSGGELPYDELPGGNAGSFDAGGTIYTSALINNGALGNSWTFSDVNDCNSVVMNMGAYTCPVTTNAGTMVLTPQVVCGTAANPGTATATWNNNGVLDGNDAHMFILHTTANNTAGVVIATDCGDGLTVGFGDAGTPLTFGAVSGPGTIVSGTTYYISSVAGDDSGIGVGGCVNLAAANVQISPGVPVTWYQRPVVNYSINDTDLCQGECATIHVTVTPSPFSIQFSESPADATLGLSVGQNSPFDYNICPNTTTDYTLDSVFVTAAPQCSTVLNQTITVNVNPDIVATPTDTVCNNIGTQYQVIYTLSGGELPYDEDPAGAGGTFDAGGTVFTTNWINSGSGAGPWSFSDVNNCNIEDETVLTYTCPVLTNAGTMNLTPLVICGGTASPATATAAWNNNGFLDGNDEHMFILHTTSNNTAGVVVATDCGDGATVGFGDVDTPLTFGAVTGAGTVVSGTTYYISSVAGDDSGLGVGGCVDMAAPNVKISPGVPVIWYQAATADLTVVGDTFACQGSTVTLKVTFTGQGPWSFIYTKDGVPQPTVSVTVANNPYIFTVSSSGNYCLQSVTNSPGGCNGTVSGCVNVVINPLPTAVFDGNGVTCAGTNYCFDIDLTGTAPYTFTVNDPDAVNDVLVGINTDPYSYCVGAAGPYQITTITDANNCTNNVASAIVNLTVNPLPTVQWSFPADTSFCEGTCIDLTIASTGASTFDVSITSPDANVTTADLQNIGQIQNITICEPGDYELLDITDSNGCVNTLGDLIHVDEIPTPIANAGPDLDQCVNLSMQIGTASIAGQSYTWSPLSGIPAAQVNTAQPTVTLSTAGQYTYTVTASVAQCSSIDAMQLTIHDLPVVSITPDDDSICFNTCTNLVASGADNYVWNASASITTGLNLASVTACPDVDETFQVTGYETHNAIQCQSTETVDIVVGEALSVVLDYSDELCFLQCNGFANFEPAGGFEPYTINLDPSLNWTNLCADIYAFTLEDSQGCSLDSTFEITERPEEIIDIVTPTNPICFGDATGMIELQDASGTSFSLNNVGTGDDVLDNIAPFEFDNLTAGDYIISMAVLLPSGLQCADTTLVTLVSLSPEMTINVPWTQQLHCYGDEVCFEADIQGGFGGLIAHWNVCPDAFACQVSTANPFCLILTQDTTMYVYGTDQNLCPTDTLMMSATLYPDISLILQNGLDSVEVCEYSCIDLTTQTSGGNGNIFVDWYEIPVDNAPFTTADTITVCPFYSSPFVYYYVIANDGCSTPVTDTIKVVVHDTPEVILTADTLEACYPDTISFHYEIDPGFSDNHICTWRPGDGLSYNYCADTSFVYTAAGNFYPSMTVTSEYGCVGGDTLIDPVVIHGYPEIDFTWDPQPVDVLHLEVQFINLTEGADSIRWNFYNAGTSGGSRPIWTFPDVETTNPFPICLEAINGYGCKDTLCQDVYIESVLEVFVPNTFTPDGDGINDVFLPIVKGVKPETYRFWVFNRWGDPIFYTEDTDKAWTGGSDDGLYYIQDGTYPWRMECEAVQDGRIEVFEGHVTILR